MEIKKYPKPEKKYSIRQDIEVEAETSPLYKARKHIQAEWDKHLILACQAGNLLEINKALDLGARINCVGDYGHTPLHIAVKKGDEHLVSALLAKGASLTIEDDFKYTPIDLAANYGHKRISFIFNIWKYKSIYDQYPSLTKKIRWN